jgi:hypothetical protein
MAEARKARGGTFKLTQRDPELQALVDRAGHRTLAVWAKACAERVLLFFEKARPGDPRPRAALQALQEWIEPGGFRMAVIRKASLDAHAAARDAGTGTPACSAARAAGQAVATAHVRTHAIGAPQYTLQALDRAAAPADCAATLANERMWQLERLRELMDSSGDH